MQRCENKAVIMSFMARQAGGGGGCWVVDKSIDPSQPLCVCECVCVCVVKGGLN